MTKFKAGDKVFIHDEELTNPEGPSMYQNYRGTEGKIRGVHATGGDTYWVDVEEGIHSALLSGKHLELIETFKEGDWVFVKDEPLTQIHKYTALPEKNTWYEVDKVYSDGDVHLKVESGRLLLVQESHLTLNPFKVGDQVNIAPNPTFDHGVEVGTIADSKMRANPVVTDLPDADGDIRIDGLFVHKRFVAPDTTSVLWAYVSGYMERLAADTPPEAVDHPEHYNQGAFEAIDVIEDWGLNFNVGNAVKYISRYEHKGNPKEDLRKAIWYLNRELESLGGGDAINP